MFVILIACIVSIRLEQKNVESHKKLFENKDFCDAVMASEDNKILEFKQYQKSDKTPSTIYDVLESLIKRKDECKNNSKKLSTKKVGGHIPCGYSISTIWTFDGIEKKFNEC